MWKNIIGGILVGILIVFFFRDRSISNKADVFQTQIDSMNIVIQQYDGRILGLNLERQGIVSHYDSLERIKDFELVEYRKKVKVYEKDLHNVNSINQSDLLDSIAKYYARESISGHSIDQRMVPDNR
jgi:hypothetical protein